MRDSVLGVALAAMLGFAATVAYALDMPEGIGIGDSAKGQVLVNHDRMSLYTFSADPPNQSVCIGGCSANWPPALAPDDAKPMGDFSIVKRDDGARQWAYRERPLYTWVQDQNPGDTTGDGMGGKWALAKP